MAWVIFHTYMENQEDGSARNLDTGGDLLKCMLVTDVRAPVQATDEDTATIDNTEVTGDGYTAGGATLANQSITLAAGTVTFDCDDITWSQGASGFTNARYAIIYYDSLTPANNRVICYADLGGDKGNNDGDLTLEMNASGIWTKTTS